MSSNRQNYQSDIPNGRSTSRIKNASKSQGFANKELYGSSAQTRTVNGQFYKSQNNNQKTTQRQSYVNNSRNNDYRTVAQQSRSKAQNNNGEISESTMVKVIVGSILGAVLLAIIIIIALVIMNFQL